MQQQALITLTQDVEHGKKLQNYLEKLVDEARKNIQHAQQQYKIRYDQHRQELSLKINDLVLIKTRSTRNKFDIRYEGPFKITKQLGRKTFIVQHVKKTTSTKQVAMDVIVSKRPAITRHSRIHHITEHARKYTSITSKDPTYIYTYTHTTSIRSNKTQGQHQQENNCGTEEETRKSSRKTSDYECNSLNIAQHTTSTSSTPIDTIEQLICRAATTKRYTIDTESQSEEGGNTGALIQIEMVHSSDDSTDREDEEVTHPKTESRETTEVSFDTPGDNDFYDDDDDGDYKDTKKTKYSLQAAVEMTLQRFLDKAFTRYPWSYGLDLALDTWQQKLFQKKHYDMQVERQTRVNLINYTVHDCTAVTEIYRVMYPERKNQTSHRQQTATKTIYPDPTPKITPSNQCYQDDLSDISDDEIELYLSQTKVKYHPVQANRQQEPAMELEIEPDVELETNPEQQPERTPKPKRTEEEERQRKKEIQRRKNEKYKEKKRTRPDSVHRIIRPIYYRYDYRKIRAQLQEDEVRHTHQIRINEAKSEVTINFKSDELREDGKKKVPISYFTHSQYYKRWKQN
ncbi:unnamed protein product [Adineta ricciae]|uniref:Uncharacterized protein n=1 Tax=Adineta ricciae TaxID=249248 RepID=A0A815TQB9_ADIRI|nr:unnamed protein product [Adineta ricciae]CAF1538412.1 unnamed protein product [Adineta ricciae]